MLMIGDGYFTFHSMAFAKGHRQLGMSRYFRDASSTRIVIFDIVMFNILLSVACIASTSRAATRIYRLNVIVSQPGVSMEAQIRRVTKVKLQSCRISWKRRNCCSNDTSCSSNKKSCFEVSIPFSSQIEPGKVLPSQAEPDDNFNSTRVQSKPVRTVPCSFNCIRQ